MAEEGPSLAAGPPRRGRWLAAAGAALILALVVVAVAAPWLTPYDPTLTVVPHYTGPLPPRPGHPLGTDTLGRDVWSRLAYGARISLFIGVAAMAIGMGIGVSVGLVAGYFGGITETLLMRLVDVVMALPSLLLAIALATIFAPSLGNVLLVVGLVSWTGIARTVRGEVLSLKEREFLLAARALGASHVRIMARHLLPSLLPTILILAALSSSATILIDAGLSYLGLGVPLPTPSWGRMVSEAQTYFHVAPWLMAFPGLAITLAVVGFNLLGHGLIDLLAARGN